MSFSFLNKPENQIESLMGDVVRVLSILLGKLWMSELSAEVSSFRISLNRPLDFTDADLREAVKRLGDLKIVETKDGLRATFGKPQPDTLVGLIGAHDIIENITSDPDVKKYRMMLKLNF
ncbi:MAG: hypothetical protein QXJ17_06695 [Nitrososphaeria archaeon]